MKHLKHSVHHRLKAFSPSLILVKNFFYKKSRKGFFTSIRKVKNPIIMYMPSFHKTEKSVVIALRSQESI